MARWVRLLNALGHGEAQTDINKRGVVGNLVQSKIFLPAGPLLGKGILLCTE